jgi:hypothetical protein
MGSENTLYCTLAEMRTQIEKIGTTGAGSDAALTLVITAVSRAIDRYTNREDGAYVADTVASARYYSGSGRAVQYIDECVEISGVSVKDSATDDEDSYTAWAVGVIGTTTNADVFPATGDPKYPNYTKKPYTLLLTGVNGNYAYFPSGRFTGLRGFAPDQETEYGLPTVMITAKWGYSVNVPENIKQAAIIESARVFKRGEGTWADAIANAETGELRFTASLDPATKAMLYRYKRPSIGWTGGG